MHYLKQRSALFNKYNIPVAAFIPVQSNPRGPIFAGLPTLEAHHSVSSIISAKHLIASKEISCIILGDPIAAEQELKALSKLNSPTCLLTPKSMLLTELSQRNNFCLIILRQEIFSIFRHLHLKSIFLRRYIK